jgi:hypothetical protein
MVDAHYKQFATLPEKDVASLAICCVFQAIRFVAPQLMTGSLFASRGGGIYDRRTRRLWHDRLRWKP